MLVISAHTSTQRQTGFILFFKAGLIHVDVCVSNEGLPIFPTLR